MASILARGLVRVAASRLKALGMADDSIAHLQTTQGNSAVTAHNSSRAHAGGTACVGPRPDAGNPHRPDRYVRYQLVNPQRHEVRRVRSSPLASRQRAPPTRGILNIGCPPRQVKENPDNLPLLTPCHQRTNENLLTKHRLLFAYLQNRLLKTQGALYSPVPPFATDDTEETKIIGKNAAGMLSTFETARTDYGLELRILGQRQWYQEAQSERKTIAWNWQSSWGMITDINKVKFEYSVPPEWQ